MGKYNIAKLRNGVYRDSSGYEITIINGMFKYKHWKDKGWFEIEDWMKINNPISISIRSYYSKFNG